MAGTANYTTDTLFSMDKKDPLEERRYTKSLEDVSKNIQRYSTGGPVVGLNPYQQKAISSQYLAGEQARREAAAAGALGTAGMIDARLTNASNALNDAETKTQNAQDDLYQKQAQELATIGFNEKEALRGIDDKKDQIDWGLEKNQTVRDDALEDAWVKGIADDVLQEHAISGQLKLQDLDQYFTLKRNAVDQQFKDWQNQTDIDWKKMLAEITASAEAFAMLFGGAMTAVSAGGQYIYGGK
jgi:hypothetical protein